MRAILIECLQGRRFDMSIDRDRWMMQEFWRQIAEQAPTNVSNHPPTA